jgi:xylulokinase
MSARQVLTGVETASDVPLDPIVFSGGGARSDLWTQIHADVLGRPVQRVRVCDSAMVGAALLGAVSAGIYPDIQTGVATAVEIERVFPPIAENADRLDPLYALYTAAQGALAPIHTDLAAWRRAGGVE